MTKKETEILDKQMSYLSNYVDMIKSIRQSTGINPQYDFLEEFNTVERLYKSVLEDRKKFKSNHFCTGSSGWNVVYFRDKKKYKKGEKFTLKIYHSFVYTDNIG